MCTPVTLRTYLAGGSIFTAIQTVENFPFFVDNTPTDLDSMLKLTHGNKTMFTSFIDTPVNDVAKFIVKTYGDKWNGLITFNNSNINIGADSSRKITGNETQVGNRNTNTDVENKVSAFNSDVLITDTGTTTKEDENTDKVINRDSTDEKISFKSAYDNLSLVEKTNIISTVLKDVATYLTISVY